MERKWVSVNKRIWGMPAHLVIWWMLVVFCATFLLGVLGPSQVDLPCKPEDFGVGKCPASLFPYYLWIWPIAFFDGHNGGFVALFTLVLVIVGYMQRVQMQRQSQSIAQQLELGRAEFIASHRPKLIVRRISLDVGDLPATPRGRSTKFQFVVANTGESAGTIIEGSVSYEKTPSLPPIPPFTNEEKIPRFRINRGQHFAHFFYPRHDDEQWLQLRKGGYSDFVGGNSLWFYGYICYVDDIKDENLRGLRRTGFCFRYNSETDRFDKVDDPNYSYED
jgi:hypothetical protein